MSASVIDTTNSAEDEAHRASTGPQRLLGPGEEGSLFLRLRLRIWLTLVRQAFAQSRLRLTVLVVMCLVFWAALVISFTEGFSLLESAITHVPTRVMTVQAVFNVFFVALLAMLTVSAAVIFYSSCFRSEEVQLLLSTPTSTGRIVLYKFQETTLFSCWGFILLGSPMLVAYGMVTKAPWFYYAMLPPFMISFVCIPAALGTIGCFLLVWLLPSLRLHATLIALCIAAVCLAALGWMLIMAQSEDVMTPGWLDQMLSRLRFAEARLLPSWWLSSGLLEAAHAWQESAPEAWRESVMFLLLLISNALLFLQAVTWTGQKLFRPAYSRLQGVVPATRTARVAWIDRLVNFFTFFLPKSMRLLIVKDLRLFRRDPIQWTQFLIFFGLLSLYFINIRRFHYGESLTRWMNMIGFLNLGVVGLILSTFTTRFIFPMISLEGRRFWILGTLPVSRDAVLWSKFLFACCGCLPPCALLILMSDAVLGVLQRHPWVTMVHQVVCWTLCIGLSALAVGLGARLPNLREPSPSKIAAGFGGTLNLVLSSIFIVAVVVLTAVPSYWLLERPAGEMPDVEPGTWAQLNANFGLGSVGAVALGIGGVLVIGLIMTIVPLRIGFRAFRKLEF